MRTAFTLALFVTAIGVLSAQSPIRPGRWEVTMQMSMPNMPMRMPEMKTTRCVTPEEAKDPAKALPSADNGRGGSDCKVSDYKLSGNKATWKVACTKPQAITSVGEMTFTDTTYDGTMNTTMSNGEVAMKISGKRLGDCTQ